MNAIDTNVLVYSVDAFEPARQLQAIRLLDELSRKEEPLIVLWQVAVEFVACLRRWENAGRITRDDTLAYKTQFLDVQPIVMPSPAILQVSLDLSGRYSLSHWDSLLIAACLEAGVDTLYSEDLNVGMTYDAVTVVNPFA